MEVKYHKDYRHNYLILKSINTPASSYRCRMMTDNEIKGLLPCKERHINGEQLFYYEITSKQSLASFYECGGINMELLCRLFVQLKTTWDAMEDFLLEERYLVLQPEFVFMDAETKDFFFLYYPEEPEEDYLYRLLEFLTEKVDSEDNSAVDAVYKMMELAEKDQFVMDEIMQWFEQDYEEKDKTDKMFERSCEGKSEDTAQNAYEDLSMYRSPESYREEGEEEISSMHPAAKISTGVLIGNLVAALVAATGCILVYLYFELGNREMICLCAAFMASLAVLAFCAVQLFCKKYFPKKRTREDDTVSKEYRQERYTFCYSQEERNRQEPEVYGNTVFIPWTESCENKLYGMGKGNKNHIDLNHLPVTVGKLAGSVDMIINEPGISRRHVKFSRENGRICMTDLNSTNGTFKNGMRLLPNTSEILEPGDEIRLGKLKFIYR